MATRAIVAIGQRHDAVRDRAVAAIQSALIRLGFDPGPIDGVPGRNTKAAAAAAGVVIGDPHALPTLEARLRAAFPAEYSLGAGEGPLSLESAAGLRQVGLTPEGEAANDEGVLWIDQAPRRRPRQARG